MNYGLETKNSLKIKGTSYRLIFSEVLLALAIVCSVFFGKAFIVDYVSIPDGLSVNGEVFTAYKSLPSGEVVPFQSRVVDLLKGTDLKENFAVFNEMELKELPIELNQEQIGAAFVNSNFFNLINIPLQSGRSPEVNKTNEVVVSSSFYTHLQSLGFEKSFVINQVRFYVVGITTDQFCGITSSCIDVWFNYQKQYITFNKGFIDWVTPQANGDEGFLEDLLKAYASVRPSYSLFIEKNEMYKRNTLQKIRALSWDVLKEDTPVRDTAVFSPSSQQDVEINITKGVTTSPQGDAELRPVLRLIALASFSITIICFVLFILEQFMRMSRRKAEIMIKNQLGTSKAYWLKFSLTESILTIVPIGILMYLCGGIAKTFINSTPVLNQLFKTGALSINPYTYFVIGSILFVASFFVIYTFVTNSACGEIANKNKLGDETKSVSLLNNILLGLSAGIFVTGIAISYTFVSSVSQLMSPDKVGNSKDLWTGHFSYSGNITIPQSNVISQQLEQLAVKHTVFRYEPGVLGLEDPTKVTESETKEIVNTFISQVDKQFFKTFGVNLLHGNLPASTETNSILISKSLAKKLTNEPKQLIGKELFIERGEKTVTVSGVVKNVNYNSPRGVAESVIYEISTKPTNWYSFTFEAQNTIEANSILTSLIENNGLSEGDIKITSRIEALNEKNQFYLTIAKYSIPVAVTTMTVLLMIMLGVSQQIFKSKRKEIAIRVALGSPLIKLIQLFKTSVIPFFVAGITFGVYLGCAISEKLSTEWHVSVDMLTLNGFLIVSGVVVAFFIYSIAQLKLMSMADQTKLLRG